MEASCKIISSNIHHSFQTDFPIHIWLTALSIICVYGFFCPVKNYYYLFLTFKYSKSNNVSCPFKFHYSNVAMFLEYIGEKYGIITWLLSSESKAQVVIFTETKS